MSDFSTLAYLDVLQAKNQFKRLLHQPARLVLYVLVGGYFLTILIVRAKMRTMSAFHGIGEPFASAIGFGGIAFVAAGFLAVSLGRVATFQSAADARFLIGSQLRERNVLAWLQLRSSWRFIARFLFLAVLYAFIFPSAGTQRGMIFSVTGLIALASSLNVPITRLRRAGNVRVFQLLLAMLVFGAVAAAAAVVAPIVLPHTAAISSALQHAGIGRAAASVLAGNGTALGMLWGAAFALMALSYVGATDLYPELYTSSMNALEARVRMRRQPFGNVRIAPVKRSSAAHSASSPGPYFAGAWTALWKDAVTFSRVKGAWAIYALLFVVASTGGAALGAFARASGGDDGMAIAYTIVISIGNVLLLVFAIGSSVALAQDIRKPLWWISSASLRSRLYVWTVATSWRWMLLVTAAVAACAAALRDVQFAEIVLPAIMVLIPFVRAIGLALYSLFPFALDQRGPVAMLRMLLCYALLLPAFGIGVATGFLAHSISGGAIVTLIFALVESAALVEFAAHRIARAGIGIAEADAA